MIIKRRKRRTYNKSKKWWDANYRKWNINQKIQTVILRDEGKKSWEEIAQIQGRTAQRVSDDYYSVQKYSLDDLEDIRKKYFPD